MKRLAIHTFCLLFSINSFAQVNLVPNWSFEDTVNCPTGGSQLYNALGWLNPSSATPDYFNACGAGVVNVPNCTPGFQYAKTGNAYAGIHAYSGGSVKEYIEIKLTDSLKKDQRYCVSFYLSLANVSGTGINKIGTYFSNGFAFNATIFTLPYVPQFESNPALFFLDTANWMKVEGSFIANGGENYLTIGNFHDDSLTDTIQIITGATGAYYHIDDVSVTECTINIEIPNIFTPNNDGINDVFKITNSGITSLNCKIYDRWGLKVGELSDLNDFWDGRTTGGVECPDGVYFYILTAKGTNQKEYNQKGFIHLIH